MDDHRCEDYDGECYGWGWHAAPLGSDTLEAEGDELVSIGALSDADWEAYGTPFNG